MTLKSQYSGALDGFPRIERSTGVCGGEPCIAGTRIPVWILVRARQLGATDSQLLESYPSLRAADLAEAWLFAETNTAAIENSISENETA